MFLLACAAADVSAFDVVGHRIVAAIAYDNLTDAARRATDSVLGTRGIIYEASWADEIKSDDKYAYSYAWHYQNLKPGLGDSQLMHLLDHPAEEGEHLFLAIQSMTDRLERDRGDAEALKFLVHFIGDLHQPLHLGRAEDLGGNKLEVTWLGKTVNLHRVWDELLVESRRMSSSEYAQYLEDKFEKEKNKFEAQTLFDSVKASYTLAGTVYGYDLTNMNAYRYTYRFAGEADRMLFMAGIQLAGILNSIYQ